MQISEDIINRKGARKGTDIPRDVWTLLNQGEIESVNLTEWLAVNQSYDANTACFAVRWFRPLYRRYFI